MIRRRYEIVKLFNKLSVTKGVKQHDKINLVLTEKINEFKELVRYIDEKTHASTANLNSTMANSQQQLGNNNWKSSNEAPKNFNQSWSAGRTTADVSRNPLTFCNSSTKKERPVSNGYFTTSKKEKPSKSNFLKKRKK